MRSLLFAILCLIFTASNDFLFKLFGRRKSTMGGFVMLVGGIGAIIAIADHPDFSNCMPTILWGLLVGFFSCSANLLLIPSIARLPMGVGSTLYRLNMIGVILGGWLIFHEQIPPIQWLGIAAALLAVLFFFPTLPKNFPEEKTATANIQSQRIGFLMGIGALLLRAIMGLVMKGAANAGTSSDGVSLMTCICWIIGGLLWYLFAEHPRGEKFLEKRSSIYAIISGVLVYMIIRCSNEMVAGDGKVTITLPLAQMSFVLSAIMGFVFLKEKCTLKIGAGILCGMLAVVFLVLSSPLWPF